ncbi:MAG: type 1 glutamine amidotransferase [Bacteroidales bacterium]|nr:type 1 glutamine amidotransferase [Bacteroidales bacterium]MCF8402837.1 type 1 glutamine amidotransferase [Bacteroidales bacterium]
MKFTIFHHVSYESPGFILDWIKSRGYTWQGVKFYEKTELPSLHEVENLIVMGGPMNIYDVEEYSWLGDERDFIKNVIGQGKKVLGVCLGAQFIADALGAKVYKNEHTEIGWFNVKLDKEKLPRQFEGVFPENFTTFHWHGDTFDVPVGATSFIHSEATLNQAFVLNNAAALQFHMEMTAIGVKALVEQNQTLFEQELPFVQKPGQILNMNEKHQINRTILFRFLDKFFEK